MRPINAIDPNIAELPGHDRGRLIWRNGNRMQRFEGLLDRLPKGHVSDGELVVLDDAGRPLFNKLLFGRIGKPVTPSPRNNDRYR